MKLLSLSGFIPECFCDIIRFTGYHGDRNLPHYCGYASDFISQVLSETDIDGAIFPKSCDSSRIMKSYLEPSGKFLYQFPVPARTDRIGEEYFISLLKDFEHALQHHFPEDSYSVRNRIELINQRNQSLQDLYLHLEDFSFYDFLCSVHSMLSKPLSEQTLSVEHLKTRTATRKRIYLIGSFLANEHIVNLMEDQGLTIVGDYLPESGRLAGSGSIMTEGDLYKNIADYMIRNKKSPTQNNFEQIGQDIRQEISERNAMGVIFVTQKYCEPYDYLYYDLKKQLDALNIPSIRISLSDSEDEGKAELSIEAFSDIL